MNLNNIMKVWNERCANEEDIIRKCEQVRELCEVRDRCLTLILNKEESYTIIEFLCTYYIFTYVFFGGFFNLKSQQDISGDKNNLFIVLQRQ